MVSNIWSDSNWWNSMRGGGVWEVNKLKGRSIWLTVILRWSAILKSRWNVGLHQGTITEGTEIPMLLWARENQPDQKWIWLVVNSDFTRSQVLHAVEYWQISIESLLPSTSWIKPASNGYDLMPNFKITDQNRGHFMYSNKPKTHNSHSSHTTSTSSCGVIQ